MPIFIKTEQFTHETYKLSIKHRKQFIEKHKNWVESLSEKGKKLSSGYLVNQNHDPGGGGVLIFEADSYDEAKRIILTDPMIENNLVSWNLHEWIPIAGKILNLTNEEKF